MSQTKEQFIAKQLGYSIGDQITLKNKLAEICGFIYDSVKFKGAKTAAEVAALTDNVNGDSYYIATTGGNLNAGGDAITTVVADVVTFNGATGLWYQLVNRAVIKV